MQSRIEEIHDNDGKILVICVDPVGENAKVVRKLKLDFPILSDPELAAIDAYGLRHVAASMDGSDIARPAVFIIDREGVVRWRELTDNWRVRVRPETVIKELEAIP